MEVALVAEPVAAAVYHAATFAPSDIKSERPVEFCGKPGETLAVDLGGGHRGRERGPPDRERRT
jgi:molecular chaperone DnaK (HSP70)